MHRGMALCANQPRSRQLHVLGARRPLRFTSRFLERCRRRRPGPTARPSRKPKRCANFQHPQRHPGEIDLWTKRCDDRLRQLAKGVGKWRAPLCRRCAFGQPRVHGGTGISLSGQSSGEGRRRPGRRYRAVPAARKDHALRVALIAGSSMTPRRQKFGGPVAYHFDPSVELDKRAPKAYVCKNSKSIRMTAKSITIAIGGGRSPDLLKGVEKARTFPDDVPCIRHIVIRWCGPATGRTTSTRKNSPRSWRPAISTRRRRRRRRLLASRLLAFGRRAWYHVSVCFRSTWRNPDVRSIAAAASRMIAVKN